MRYILLNPGPVSLSEGVRRAAVATDLCHREPEYFDLQDRVVQGLGSLYATSAPDWRPVLLSGSGTSALEAMVASLVPREGRLLVLENGVYGERLSRLAGIHGIEHDAIAHDWVAGWDLERVKEALDGGGYSHVAAVHHETTTGRLNPVADLASLCAANGAALLLDAVSSFGAEALPFDAPALVACAATANKCLHGIPGACLVMLRESALKDTVEPPRSLTLDLGLWAEHQSRRSTPFTPPVNSLLALDRAVEELLESGGWRVRRARYQRLAAAVARTLDELGVQPYIDPAESSCVLRSYSLPRGRDYASIHQALKRHGFVVYAGQGDLSAKMFRVSTMGDISDYDLARLLAALSDVFG
ncbi:aminotransferase class V-fold PLP-dependent enzyme [Elongatibacter sediminis]|uniref:2-aminoethylphosphonate--pyruvate transaminase n=1 Tax=Elongatibacter sediminis TaxID=3119006 RepID=A0AAW9RGF9_9GAMM